MDTKLPYHYTNSSAHCAKDCVDQGFVACLDPFETQEKHTSSCHATDDFKDTIPINCTSESNDIIHRYYGCPREAFCGPSVIYAENLEELELYKVKFKDDQFASGSLCFYEIVFSKEADEN